MNTLNGMTGAGGPSSMRQQSPSSFTWGRFWRLLKRLRVVIGIVGGLVQVASFAMEERQHHLPQPCPSVERSQDIPALESPAVCTTPQPADS